MERETFAQTRQEIGAAQSPHLAKRYKSLPSILNALTSQPSSGLLSSLSLSTSGTTQNVIHIVACRMTAGCPMIVARYILMA